MTPGARSWARESVVVAAGAFACSVVSAPPASAAPAPLVVVKGKSVVRVAADARYLVWETASLQSATVPTTVYQRDLLTGRSRRLAAGVDPSFGLASTSRWVVYAAGGRRLVAVTHDGSRRIVLSSALVAPLAARGDTVAWAEEKGNRQRVVVRDMSGRRRPFATAMSRCEPRRCYQLGAVALAAKGVVFTRTATSPDRSLVVRVRLGDHAVSRVAVPNDPQPDLAPSSEGALYYAFGRGWLRWDFGQARPHRVALPANPPAPLLAFERGRWFLSTRRGCNTGIVVLQRGRRTAVVTPQEVRRLARSTLPLCVALESFSWASPRALTSWAVLPEISLQAHSDFGLVGIVFGSRLTR